MLLDFIRRNYPELLAGLRAGLTDDQVLVELRKRVAESGAPPPSRRAGITPATTNEAARTIDIVLATDARVLVADWDRWEMVDEILPMQACRLDEVRDGKVPLLDCHSRESHRDVLGSILNLTTSDHELTGREHWSAAEPTAFRKAAEGHLDQRSVGYRVRSALIAEPGQSVQAYGQTYAASEARALKVATDWLPVEGSVVPIGADPMAGTRSQTTTQGAASPATTTDNRKDPKAMNKHLRTLLCRIGLADAATDDEARAFATARGLNPDGTADEARAVLAKLLELTPPPPASSGQAATSAGEGSQSIAVGDGGALTRTSAAPALATNAQIMDAFSPWAGMDEMRTLRDGILRDANLTLAQVHARAIEALAVTHRTTGRATVTRDAADSRRDGMQSAILLRSGATVELNKDQKDQAREYAGFSLFDLARACVDATGQSTRGMNRLDIVGRAFTASTSDFPYILANSVSKALLAAYANAPTTWKAWARRGSLSDFKAATRMLLSEAGVLELVPEGADFPQYSLSEKKESLQLATYGKIFGVTRQAIINDDLSAFGTIPVMHGRAWARTINQLAVKVLLTNGNLNDGVALFHSTHANLDTSTTTITTVATAAAVARALRLLLQRQTDVAGTSYLGLSPSLILCTPTNEVFFEQAIFETGASNNNAAIDLRRLGLKVLPEMELENANLTGYGTNLTYAFADPMDAAAIEVAFLDGNDQPRLDQEPGFTADGVQFKIAGDVAAGPVDFRGAAKHVL